MGAMCFFLVLNFLILFSSYLRKAFDGRNFVDGLISNNVV